MSVKSFENLDVFQKAYKVSIDIHKLTKTFPKDEQYSLADQMRRASKSVCANVAEGFGKQAISKAEFKRFVSIALGSSDEMRVWLRYSLDLGYLTQKSWENYKSEYFEISKMLFGLHRSI